MKLEIPATPEDRTNVVKWIVEIATDGRLTVTEIGSEHANEYGGDRTIELPARVADVVLHWLRNPPGGRA